MKSWSLFLTCIFLFTSLLQPLLLNAGLTLQQGGGNPHFAGVEELGALDENPSLAPEESQIVALVNGTKAYNNALEMEAIGLNHTLSGYSFRAAGSKGANETAKYIVKQFQSFGLETHNESFQFTTWNLLSKPTLIIDEDGNPATTYDQINISSFQSTHYSWPTPQSGVFEDLVVLPLPSAANFAEIGLNPIDGNTWNTIDTTNKILLIGREVTWDSSWAQLYASKLYSEPPVAIILTWWYDWMSFTPMMYGSAGGLPPSNVGSYYWNLQIPVGGVDYNEGLWIRNKESNFNVSASLKIESIIDSGPHYNVVGKLRGYAEPDKFVIVSGHYDSITTPGFCDNSAGTAGVIESARVLTDAAKNGLYHPRYSIIFIAFDGEEIWLAGSIYYIQQHKADMPNIVAVINLDCIGNENFVVSPTSPTGDLDLDQLVLQVAEDLGVNAALTEPGGSDHESFRDPVWANGLLQYCWGINPRIADATPVESSVMLASEPLLYSDNWATGTPGWIHTSYDNSTSTQAFGWVKIDDLQNHIKIAVLSILRVSPTVPSDTTPPTIGNPIRNPSGVVDQGQAAKISVNITDATSGVKNATLLYTVNNGSSWETPRTMNYNATTGYYETTIPGQPAGTLVKYQVVAYDNANNYKVEDNAGQYYVYAVLDVTKPAADAGSDQTVNEDTLVTFDGSASSDNVGIMAYTWIFTDVTVKTLTGPKPTYTFDTPGVYTIPLNVTDAAGNWVTDTVTITVLDITKPVVNAGQDQAVDAGATVTFDAGGSTDNVGIVSYDWNFGDGTTGTGKTTTHAYSNAGAYTVTLTARDTKGNSATDTLTVTVLSAQPPPPTEALPMWAIGGAVVVIALVAVAILLLRRRK